MFMDLGLGFCWEALNHLKIKKQVEQGIKKQVELEVDVFGKVQESTSIQPEEDEEQHSSEEVVQEQPQYNVATRRQRREIRPPNKYSSYAELVSFALNVTKEDVECREPSTYHEAVTNSESAHLVVAMNEELESLYKNQTWELVKPPARKKIIRCKWVYKKKEGTSGVDSVKYKARLITKGYG